MAVGGTRVVQITNIAPQATKDQMQTLFGYLGKIDDIRLYPTIRDVSCPVQSRICYVKFMDSTTVGIAQHMTNTVFIDRALIVIPVQNGEIPDEYKALEMTNNGTIVPGLYPADPKLPPNVVNSIEGVAPNQVIQTHDPHLEISGLPGYPPLPATYDSRKIEEVRRTALISNIDSSISSEDIIDFFTKAGEVKYIRMCTRSADGTSHALVEFSEQPSIAHALKLNGRDLKGKTICVNHATQAIVKPQAKSNEAAQREIEEAMTRVKEAQSLISAAIDPVIGMLSKDKTRGSRRSRSRSRDRRRRRSRSRSRSRRRSRSRHRSRRSRSRSKRSRSRDRKRRSRSGGRRKSRSKSRRRSGSRKSRSKSHSRSSRKDKDRGRSKDKDKKSSNDTEEKRIVKDKKKTSRSRSKSREKKRSKSRDRKRRSRDRKRSRSRGRSRKQSASPPRGSRKRSRSRESKSSKDKDKDKDRKRDKKERKERDHEKESSSEVAAKVPRNYDEEEKGFDSEKETDKNGDSSKNHDDHDESSQDSSGNRPEKESSEKSDNMDISNSP